MKHRSKVLALALVFAIAGCPEADVLNDDDDQGDDDTSVADDDTTDPDCEDIAPLDVGIYHRETAEECPAERAPLNPAPSSCGSSQGDECSSHDDCTAGANGRCVSSMESGLCSCAYDQCFSDADCSDSALCRCAEQHPFELSTNNACISAECRTDADCATGLCMGEPLFCGSADPGDTMWIVRFSCATEDDECRNHETCYCDGDNQRCHPDEGGTWVCSIDYMATCE